MCFCFCDLFENELFFIEQYLHVHSPHGNCFALHFLHRAAVNAVLTLLAQKPKSLRKCSQPTRCVIQKVTSSLLFIWLQMLLLLLSAIIWLRSECAWMDRGLFLFIDIAQLVVSKLFGLLYLMFCLFERNCKISGQKRVLCLPFEKYVTELKFRPRQANPKRNSHVYQTSSLEFSIVKSKLYLSIFQGAIVLVGWSRTFSFIPTLFSILFLLSLPLATLSDRQVAL